MRGRPVEIVIKTTESFERLNEVVQAFDAEVKKVNMLFFFSQVDLKIDRPQATIVIDRDKTAGVGLTKQGVGDGLTAMVAGG